MMELTPKVKEWLDTPEDKRDIAAGAMLLLRITRNKILYNNAMRSPKRYAKAVEYQLGKIYKQRLQEVTKAEVKVMLKQVEAIDAKYNLQGAPRKTEYQRGKRLDHDELPEEIQQLYVENGDLMRRMRDAHVKLRLVSPDTSTCPDSDRYAIAKYLIEADTKYRNNWDVYDHYIKGQGITEHKLDAKKESANAVKQCNLLLGQYAKKPNDALAKKILEVYGKILLPSEKLRNKMAEANLL